MKSRKKAVEFADMQKDQILQAQHQKLFTSFPLPYNGLYSDDDSLEQPSALKYVPTTATPYVPTTATPGPLS